MADSDLNVRRRKEKNRETKRRRKIRRNGEKD